MDGDVESDLSGDEQPSTREKTEGANGPASQGSADQENAGPESADLHEDEDAIREEAEIALDEYTDLELKVKAEVYSKELRSRREEGRNQNPVNGAAGMVRIKGGRLRMARGTAVLTQTEKRKRTIAAEKQMLKLLRRMVDRYGCSAWVLGYTTGRGQLRAACAESMTSWWKAGKVYAAQATKAHLQGRGELQQELAQLEKLPFLSLLEQLNKKQLSALISSWIRRASPSSKRYPLDYSKGSPPWWPEGLQYRKTDDLKRKDLLLIAGAAARSVCNNFPVEASIEKLEQVLSTSDRLSSETARMRALVHLSAKAATVMWSYMVDAEVPQGRNAEQGERQPAGSAGEFPGQKPCIDWIL
jgi:hypothetical protein